MSRNDDSKRYAANLQGEVDGAAVYKALADNEQNPQLAELYRRLGSIEEAHAEFWRGQLKRVGGRTDIAPSTRARALSWLARRFGPTFVAPTIAAGEARDQGMYDDQPETSGTSLPADERSHARLMSQVAGASGGLPGPELAMIEGRHKGGGGNALRAAVLGANDGLVSNLSLVMGVAGAAVDERAILLTGLAGLVAGACSMAMGEWLSVTSSRELYERQIATEAAELEFVPDEEKEELILIYQAKGLSEPQARALAEKLLANKDTALDTLAREELGIDPQELGGSPWEAAGSSFLLFSLGAIFPVAPFFFLSGTQAVIGSLISAGAALALVGAGTSLFTGRGALFSAARQLLIGYMAAGVTYGIGMLVGVSIS
ncbi:MAG: VIT1/CCC1 transporter family protein [Sphingomonadales bacterium]